MREAIEETETKITGLEGQSDDVVVEAFMNPPTESSLDTLTADSLSDATVKMSILDTQADTNAGVLDDLAEAREELETQQADESELEDAYQEARDASESELVDLQGAQSQQALFIAQVQERLDKNLSEAEALKDIDPDLAASIQARESEVATKVQEVRDAAATKRALEALALQQAQAEQQARDAAAATATPASRSPCARPTAARRTTPSTRRRRRPAARRPPARARPTTSRAWPSTSRVAAAPCRAAAAASAGWSPTLRATASTTCPASRGTGATTAPDHLTQPTTPDGRMARRCRDRN